MVHQFTPRIAAAAAISLLTERNRTTSLWKTKGKVFPITQNRKFPSKPLATVSIPHNNPPYTLALLIFTNPQSEICHLQLGQHYLLQNKFSLLLLDYQPIFKGSDLKKVSTQKKKFHPLQQQTLFQNNHPLFFNLNPSLFFLCPLFQLYQPLIFLPPHLHQCLALSPLKDSTMTCLYWSTVLTWSQL